ncbi:MAG TPA: helix-turn-helix domain-containing protein [Bacteroidales bacterium]|nr:helix-turn-helix domain-containing protein [Bacteroidales bacterium]
MKIIITTEKSLLAVIRNVIETLLDERLATQPNPTTEHPLDAYLNAGEAASFLRISLTTLYGLSSKKQIPSIKQGKKLYFNKQDLIQWLENAKSQNQLSDERVSHV